MVYSVGCFVHAESPARASDAPMILRKLRRPSSSIHSEAWRGNSRCRNSLKPSTDASSSRLRQYFLAVSRFRSCFVSLIGLSVAGPAGVELLNVVFLDEPRTDHFL